MKFYTRYNPGPKKSEDTSAPSMAFQEFKAECDINQIVKKPNLGVNPLVRPTVKPMYGDFSSIELKDFQMAQNMLADAVQKFEMLPSNVRERFSNDPAKIIEFCNDPSNIEEGIKLGIYEKKDVQIEQEINKPVLDKIQSPQNASAEATPSV